jgi:glutathione S-transferase
MLTLYHHGASVCAAKVRLALYEKGIDYEGVYIDVSVVARPRAVVCG